MSVDNSGRGSTLGPNSPRNRVSRNTESPSPTKDKSKSFYRQAFAEANILIAEGFLNLHPLLPIAVKNLLAPRPCLPADMKNLVSTLKLVILTSLVFLALSLPNAFTMKGRLMFIPVKKQRFGICLRVDLRRCIIIALQGGRKPHGLIALRTKSFCHFLTLKRR